MSIAILCPTRARLDGYRKMVGSVIVTSKAVELYTGMSADDHTYYHNHIDVLPYYIYQENLPTVQKWNLLSIEAMKDPKNKLFMLGSDDMYFDTPGWDKALLDHYNALENKIHVYHLQDSRDPNGTPHPIVTREYIEAMGYFIPPIFLHWFCDSWTVDIAKYNGVFTHFRGYGLVHDKPSDWGNPDSTFSRIRHFGWHDRDQYVAQECRHFLDTEKLRLKVELA